MKLKKNKQVELLFEEHQHEKKRSNDDYDKQHEIHKAVAQAWHSHFNNARVATCEFDVRRRNFKGVASRFRLEALNKVTGEEGVGKKVDWQFNESLWDSYEIVAVSKRLETGLVLGYDHSCDLQKIGENNCVFRKRKESKNSLRNLFNVMSSRRFNDADIADVGY